MYKGYKIIEEDVRGTGKNCFAIYLNDKLMGWGPTEESAKELIDYMLHPTAVRKEVKR